jgi:hypothetical protein
MAAIVVTAQTPEVLSACRGGTFASCAGVDALLVIGALPHAINRASGDNVAQAQSPLWGCGTLSAVEQTARRSSPIERSGIIGPSAD